MDPWAVSVILALLAALRVAELAWSRHNERRLRARGAERLAEDGFGAIVAVQIVFFFLLGAEGIWAPWTGIQKLASPVAAVLWLAGAGLRYWAIFTLGGRWSVRVLRLPGAPLVASGPYRWLTHPNYVGVLVEHVALPVIFGAWATATVGGLLHAAAILRRIRLEEKFLSIR